MPPALLDTETLSEILKGKNASAVQKADVYLRQHQAFAFSAFTRYEVPRGLKLKTRRRSFGSSKPSVSVPRSCG